MQIIVESRDADATPMRELSIARVRFALRRLKALVPRAKVQFSDVNGPRGGIDKRCQIQLTTDGLGTVVVHATRRHAVQALEAALKRASTALVRQWQKQRRLLRQPARSLAPQAAP